MPIRLDTQAADFTQRFRAFLAPSGRRREDVERPCAASSPRCAQGGDRALIELTSKFDRVDLAKAGLRVSQAEIDGAAAQCGRRRSMR